MRFKVYTIPFRFTGLRIFKGSDGGFGVLGCYGLRDGDFEVWSSGLSSVSL